MTFPTGVGPVSRLTEEYAELRMEMAALERRARGLEDELKTVYPDGALVFGAEGHEGYAVRIKRTDGARKVDARSLFRDYPQLPAQMARLYMDDAYDGRVPMTQYVAALKTLGVQKAASVADLHAETVPYDRPRFSFGLERKTV